MVGVNHSNYFFYIFLNATLVFFLLHCDGVSPVVIYIHSYLDLMAAAPAFYIKKLDMRCVSVQIHH